MDQDSHEHSRLTENALKGFLEGEPSHRRAVQKCVARIVGRHCKANIINTRPARQEVAEHVLDELLEHLFEQPWTVPGVQDLVDKSAAKHAKRIQRQTKRVVTSTVTEDGEFNPMDVFPNPGFSPDEQLQFQKLFLLLYDLLADSMREIGPPYDDACGKILRSEPVPRSQRTRALNRLRKSMLGRCKRRSSKRDNRELYQSLAEWIDASGGRGSKRFFGFVQGIFQGKFDLDP